MNSQLYKKHNYLNKGITFINKSIITEYDMKNAGIEILRFNDIIKEKDYDYLMSLSKLQRNVVVGKFLRENSDVNSLLMEGFIEVRRAFFETNNIDDDDVLSIKKDAIFLINKTPKQTKLNEFFEFRPKNNYNSYILINNKEHYYSSNEDKLDVKGYAKGIYENQKDYLFKFLKECLELKLNNNDTELFRKLILFKDDFISRNLDNEFYRDIITNKFNVKIFDTYYIRESIDDEFKNHCEINNNLNFIIEIINKLL